MLVVGGSVAGLVAAEQAARRGERVTVLLPPEGASVAFRPLKLDGRVLQFGPRLIELEYVTGENKRPVPPWSEYQPGCHRPWQGCIASYLCDLLGPDLVEVEPPQMIVNGEAGPDIYFTSDLTHLRAHDVGPFEPGPRSMSPDYWCASHWQHGPAFHDLFIAPFLDRMLPGRVHTSLRNKVWMPLYWPETLRQACGTGPVDYRPGRRFWTDSEGGMGLVVERLLARLDHPLVTIDTVDDPAAHVRDDAIVALPVPGLERVQVTLVWVEADVPTTTMVVDPLPCYRVSRSGPGLAVLEYGYATTLDDAVNDAARWGRVIHAKTVQAYPAPTHANMTRAAAARIPGRRVAGFGADSLNEQIAQGLACVDSR